MMKRKITSIILILALATSMFLLTGCAPKEGDYVFETYDKGALSRLSEESPTSVEVYHDEAGTGYCFYMDSEDSQTAFDITDAFRSLKIIREVSPDAGSGTYYDITFDFATIGAITVSFNGNYISYFDPKTKAFHVYELEGCDVLQELILNGIYSKCGWPTVYETILDSEGIKLEMGDYYEDEDGDFIVEIRGQNNTENDVYYSLDPTVNGFSIYSSQTLSLPSGGDVMTYFTIIPSSILKGYGINNIGEVKYTIDVYEDNEDGFQILSTDDPVVIQTDLYYVRDTRLILNTPLYEKNGITIYGKRDEADTYTGLMMYYMNDTENEKAFSLNKLVTDKSSLDVESYNEAFTVVVEPGETEFVYIPLYNFEWDESTGITTKKEISTIKAAFDIYDGKKVITTKSAVVK